MKKINSKKSLSSYKTSSFELYLLIFPFVILFFLTTVLPVLSSIALSFFRYDMVSFPKICGLENYLRMFLQDDIFPVVLKNTFLLAILTGPSGFALSFLLAWIINEFGPAMRTFFSFLFYAPTLAGNAIYIWQVAFSSDSYGYINSFLLSFGIITEPIVWLKNETYLMPIIIIVQLWQSMGVSLKVE